MMPMTLRSWPAGLRASSAPRPAERQGREDRQRVDEALVEHAQDDVDGEQRRQDQQRLAASDCWNACAVPWNEPSACAAPQARRGPA